MPQNYILWFNDTLLIAILLKTYSRFGHQNRFGGPKVKNWSENGSTVKELANQFLTLISTAEYVTEEFP